MGGLESFLVSVEEGQALFPYGVLFDGRTIEAEEGDEEGSRERKHGFQLSYLRSLGPSFLDAEVIDVLLHLGVVLFP